jgi:hypothetical protein
MRLWKKITIAVAVLLLGLAVWVWFDLGDNSRYDLRKFDGHEVARLETAMWRSYYGHERFKLFRELAELLRLQYRLPFWRSYVAAYSAAHAAAVFQSGHNRTEYLRALPDLESFYSQILQHSERPFDVKKVAAAELEWWIVHRERAQHKPGGLEASLAELQSLIYQQPAARFEDHAKARAEAMLLRDGSPSEPDWRRIGALLDRSWIALQLSVNSN